MRVLRKFVPHMKNLLTSETSPYLLQHKDNPVHWVPWSIDALNRARAENKPILLSIGYSACHWCHVMAHESFEDEQIAAQMNQHFINIKVDREERPDLDNIYQMSLQIMGEQGGWPLTMFLNSEGKPFWGGTYFPPVSQYGRPGFSDILAQISKVYTEEPEKITSNSERMTAALMDNQVVKSGGELSLNKINQATHAALGMMDMVLGGTQGAPKFPQPVLLNFLWLGYSKSGQDQFKDALTITLDNICLGGIYDHIGGGLSRYSVDEIWLAPHFEKMLYDNAQMIELMSDVWKVTKSELYKERITETIGWMTTDLRIDHGNHYGLASARDADSEGVEGKYYVWSKVEITELLGDDAELFCQTYNIKENGNWEGTNIPHKSLPSPNLTKEQNSKLTAARAVLLKVREARVPPLRDDKILADWNGLAISGLVRCAGVFDNTDWLNHAKQIFAFVEDNMVVDHRLKHSWCDGQVRHRGTLDDHANMAKAALDLYQSTTEPAYLTAAIDFTNAADEWFWDTNDHGYYLSASDTDDVFMRNKVIYDNPTPSGNGVMLEVLARLFILTGEAAYETRAKNLIDVLCPVDARSIINQPSLGLGFDILVSAPQVIIAVPVDVNIKENAIFKMVLATAPASYVVSVVTPDTVLPTGHPAFGKSSIDGKATTYVCRNQTCTLPITDMNELADLLMKVG